MPKEMKKIKFLWVAKAQAAYMRMFEALDEDYPDYRAVKANERAIEHWIGKMTQDKEEYFKIYEIIESGSFDIEDHTFKPICNRLRELGYEIERC